MLDHLSEFCILYAYSHGLKHYILEVLNHIDPEEKWFKERQMRVVAPADEAEQLLFGQKGKSAKDFGLDIEQGDWLIIDDQYRVIKEKGNHHLSIIKRM